MKWYKHCNVCNYDFTVSVIWTNYVFSYVRYKLQNYVLSFITIALILYCEKKVSNENDFYEHITSVNIETNDSLIMFHFITNVILDGFVVFWMNKILYQTTLGW